MPRTTRRRSASREVPIREEFARLLAREATSLRASGGLEGIKFDVLLARGVPFFRDRAPTRGVSVQSPGSALTTQVAPRPLLSRALRCPFRGFQYSATVPQ